MTDTSAADDRQGDPRAAAALAAAALLAVDPHGLGGVRLKGPAGPIRDAWMARLHAFLAAEAPVVRIPAHAGAGRLLGDIDLTATLATGRPVRERGLLAGADGGILELRSAERIDPQIAAILSAALDRGVAAVAREGFTGTPACRFGLVALDESGDDDPPPPVALVERLGLRVDLSVFGALVPPVPAQQDLSAARARLPGVTVGADMVEALVRTGEALGVRSERAVILAVRAARAAAALAGRPMVAEADAELAAVLTLAPRATRRPAPQQEPAPAPDPAEDAQQDRAPETDDRNDAQPPSDGGGRMEDRVLAAATAALPPHLLDLLTGQDSMRRGATPAAGRRNRNEQAAQRGRQIGSAAGDPRRGPRLDLIATLRAAVPWQRVRALGATGSGLRFRASDLRVRRYRVHKGCTTIFCVDASGSAALDRLAEAKGAVEQMLASCYVRRDEVALVAFRGRDAEIVVPPTRSLQRARTCLAGLPGGGGTPLADGIATACRMAQETGLRGRTPTLVVITDGRSNVGFGGVTGRERATADALSAARDVSAQGIRALLIDSSSRPEPQARALASTMGALYLPLPHADAAMLYGAVRAGADALMAVRP
ncbi:magnesium chelatase subunit D [Phreatobacter sp.]|uniref:magnesium chelatase subunit D n=1 Tax=Phreatobacter sp. TaxID=1966341 RepID=UPI0025CBFAC6|nr:magnesium chelatase subunit D [Phreatobacter sp.]